MVKLFLTYFDKKRTGCYAITYLTYPQICSEHCRISIEQFFDIKHITHVFRILQQHRVLLNLISFYCIRTVQSHLFQEVIITIGEQCYACICLCTTTTSHFLLLSTFTQLVLIHFCVRVNFTWNASTISLIRKHKCRTLHFKA